MIGTGEWYLVGLSLGVLIWSLLDSPNPGLTGIILDMSLSNPLGSLIDYIWHINWYAPWIGTWKVLWYFNWVTSLLFSWIGPWNTYWQDDGTFTWELSRQVYWGISRISFVLLFFLPLEALFDSGSWSNVLQFNGEIPPGSKVRYPDVVVSPLRATLVVPPSGSCPKFPPPPYGTFLTSP